MKLSENIFFAIRSRRLQSLLISVYNLRLFLVRYGPYYWICKYRYQRWDMFSKCDLETLQRQRMAKFFSSASLSYTKFFGVKKYTVDQDVYEYLSYLPVLTKRDLIENKSPRRLLDLFSIKSSTGGTTGASLVVKYKFKDVQDRQAYLDFWRGKYGWKIRSRTAWFSGKNIVSKDDLEAEEFWKTDRLFNIRYYSTFHISHQSFHKYLDNLDAWNMEFIVGFPSTIVELAKFGLDHGRKYKGTRLKAIFPTAESITSEIRSILLDYFGVDCRDQYASSEGAPFITECPAGRLHIQIHTGVFRIQNNGELLVTSFSTGRTPLINYDIGDVIELDSSTIGPCDCGSHMPIAEKIIGRKSETLPTPMGNLNLGNISNTTKGVQGIIQFQVHFKDLYNLKIFMVVSSNFDKDSERKFIENWRNRIGQEVNLELTRVGSIERSSSGKFQMIVHETT